MTLTDPQTFAGTFWIVRSADERTTAACLHLIRRVIPEERTALVRERPFSKALEVTYKLALAKNYAWTVVIDADVYVHMAGFAQLVALARTQPRDVFYVQGLTVDKFIPIIRSAGSGMYRTELLPLALKGLPKEANALRPESVVVQSVLRRGYRMWRTSLVVGMHDFDQAYADVVRKAYLHVNKHANVLDQMVQYWRARASEDQDFVAALLGYALSSQHQLPPVADREFMRAEYAGAVDRAGLDPKPPLEPQSISAQFVEQYLRQFRTDPSLQKKKFPEYERNYFIPVQGGKWTRRWVAVKGWWLRNRPL